MKLSQLDAQTYVALIFLILGGGYLLQELQIINFSWLLSHGWPLFIVGFGFLHLAQNKKNRTPSLIIIAIGTILAIGTMGQLDINLWSLIWPFILILIGIAFLRKPTVKPTDAHHHTTNTIMGDDKQQITSQSFQGSNHFVLMGATKIDLSKAKLVSEATIQANVVMGELKITLPPNTRVVNQAGVILGEFNDRTRPSQKPTSTVTVEGFVLMGTVEFTD